MQPSPSARAITPHAVDVANQLWVGLQTYPTCLMPAAASVVQQLTSHSLHLARELKVRPAPWALDPEPCSLSPAPCTLRPEP